MSLIQRLHPARILAVALLQATPVPAQMSDDPFGAPLSANGNVIRVDYEEFAEIPDVGGETSRMMELEDEPASGRMFLNGMRGPIYTVGYDGTVAMYLDINAPEWGVSVESGGRERGFQSFALHPQFGEAGAPGYGKLYAWTDTDNTAPAPDFVSGGGADSHDTVLLEWTADDASGARYDGGAPRELMRFEQPFGNHNGGADWLQPPRLAGGCGLRAPLHGRRGRGGAGGIRSISRRTWPWGSGRSSASIPSAATAGTERTGSRQTTPSRATVTPIRWARSTPTASGTRRGSRGIPTTGISSSRTSGRISWRS